MTITATTLADQPFGGLINEEVMQEIWDISKIPLPLSDLLAEVATDNAYTEWTKNELAPPDITNAVVDGADTDSLDDAKLGERVGNHHTISVKVVKASTRAQASDTIGMGNVLATQVMDRQRELHRDVEAQNLTNQPSVKDDGNTVAGRKAGIGAWLETNTDRGVGGTDGGFNTTTGIVDAPGLGTARALSETSVRDVCEMVYMEGGNPSVLMSLPQAIRKLSEYMFTDQARIAVLQSDAGQSNEAMRAKGAVQVFLTDFGVSLDFQPNRLQQPSAVDTCDVFILDPSMLQMGLLHGYRVEPLAKRGLSDQRQMAVDHTLKVLTEKAHGVVADVNYTVDAVQ